MAVTWVAGTDFSQTTGTSIAANAPAGVTDGDTLLAGVFARSTITPPSGWTLVRQCVAFNGPTSAGQRLAVYTKDSTTSADASSSFTWSQASSEVMGVAYAAVRGAGATIESEIFSRSDHGEGDIWTEFLRIEGTAAGQMLIVFGNTTDGDPAGGDPTAPSGMTLFTQSSASDYRLAGAYQAVGLGDGGAWDYFVLDDDYFGALSPGISSVTVLLEASDLTEYEVIISADGPLGSPQLVGGITYGGLISAESPLGAVNLLGFNDISGAVNSGGTSRYYMDLITPDGDVRVPVSSWQATLQTDSAQYVQCVVPNCGDWVDDLTAATEFRISRLLTLNSGETLEYVITQAPLETIQYARGSTNHTATLSGYIDEVPAVTWPEGTERALDGVQTVFTYSSGVRVRCSIDWLLQPGQEALLEGTPFTVSYITYIVSEAEAYMDVGERTE